jgi:predicted MPP superfamily phosphohydrolase
MKKMTSICMLTEDLATLGYPGRVGILPEITILELVKA